jgi:hypothetical protein
MASRPMSRTSLWSVVRLPGRRAGARCRRYRRPVSPTRPPNRTCPFLSIRLSTGHALVALGAGVWQCRPAVTLSGRSTCERRSSSCPRRASSPSRAAIASGYASSVLTRSKAWAPSHRAVRQRPRALIPDPTMSQQQLGESMPAAHQIATDLISGSSQVPSGLSARGRDRDRGQRSGHQLPERMQRVLAVALDLFAAGARGLARRDHIAQHPRPPRCPIQPIAGGAGLIASTDRRWQPAQPLHHRIRGPGREHATRRLAAHHGKRRSMNRTRVDIHRRPCHRSGRGRTSFVWGQPEPLSGQTNPRLCHGFQLRAGDVRPER